MTKHDKLDILDIKIISELLDNCRKSDRQIGINHGISGGAINSRISKLIKNKIIENFLIRVEPPILGYGIIYFVVSGENIDEIFGQLKIIGDPYLVVPCVGGITVCGIVVKNDLQEKLELVKKLMKDFRLLSIFEEDTSNSNSQLTKTDILVLEKLVKDPKVKIDTISKELKISTKTIARCIEKMEKNESVLFTLIYNPKKLEHFISYAVIVNFENNLQKTLNELNKKFSKFYLQKPFIAKNQIVLFLYADNIFSIDENTQEIRRINNVVTADLFIPKKIIFYKEWLEKSISDLKKSTRLHLSI